MTFSIESDIQFGKAERKTTPANIKFILKEGAFRIASLGYADDTTILTKLNTLLDLTQNNWVEYFMRFNCLD